MELRNKSLEEENMHLREKLLELAYRQKRNNLIFEGIRDAEDETDTEGINKLRSMLCSIPGLDPNFRIDRCYRIDGRFRANGTRRLLCTFNWYVDVQFILKHRKSLQKGIYVNEDLPEEWSDHRKILKPIFNAAKRSPSLKSKTFFARDKLVINGKHYGAGPNANYTEANDQLNLAQTCERSNETTTIFLGSHSPYSNLHPAEFTINNIRYNCVEQLIQSEKAGIFNDDATQAKIMLESNPYCIKKLGSKVQGFNDIRWKKSAKEITYRGNLAKFGQNPTLRRILLDSADKIIAESSTDTFWGVGLHLHDRNALDRRHWINKSGGAMCDILSRVRRDLRKQH